MSPSGFVCRFLKRCAVAAFLAVVAACGGGSGESAPQPTAELKVLAGSTTGESACIEGTGAEARFGRANGLTVDSTGNVVVADGNCNSIRKVTPDGRVSSLIDPFARFSSPSYVATDRAGNVYVAESGNLTIRKITPAGVVSTLAGAAQQSGSVDGIGSEARFGNQVSGYGRDEPHHSGPAGIATDTAGNVFVADHGNRTIRRITPVGVVSTFAGVAGEWGNVDGVGADARFGSCWYYMGIQLCRGLTGLAADAADNLYVADFGNGTIRRVSATGVVTTIAGPPDEFGTSVAPSVPSTSGRLGPGGVAADGAGNVYVAATGLHTIRRISPAGAVSTIAGVTGSPGSNDGVAEEARFNLPDGLATDGAGNLCVVDYGSHTIRRIASNGLVTTVAGTAGMVGSSDGTGADARFNQPRGIAADSAGNLYVGDSGNHTVRRITPDGVVSTFAGEAGVEGSNDSGAPIQVKDPNDVVMDAAGNLYSIESAGGRGIVKITPAGVVTPFADLTGSGLAIDRAGNLYMAPNQGYHAILKITPAGEVSTYAGAAEESGSADGIASQARFWNPSCVAVGNDGSVYVCDRWNQTIRKIDPAGMVSTLAGLAGQQGSADGIGAEARFNFPQGLAVDSTGTVYVADTNNNTIRKITPAGVVTTIVGVAGKYGLVPGPLPGGLDFPYRLALSGTSLYITLRSSIAVVANVP